MKYPTNGAGRAADSRPKQIDPRATPHLSTFAVNSLALPPIARTAFVAAHKRFRSAQMFVHGAQSTSTWQDSGTTRTTHLAIAKELLQDSGRGREYLKNRMFFAWRVR